MTIYLALMLPSGSSDQPGDWPGVHMPPYLVLLRTGFSQPAGHPAAGELLPHHFTLAPINRGGLFLWHFPWGYPPWALPSVLPGGVRTFLPPEAGGHPVYLTH